MSTDPELATGRKFTEDGQPTYDTSWSLEEYLAEFDRYDGPSCIASRPPPGELLYPRLGALYVIDDDVLEEVDVPAGGGTPEDTSSGALSQSLTNFPPSSPPLGANRWKNRGSATPDGQPRAVRAAPPAEDALAEVRHRTGDNAVPDGRQPRFPCPRTQRKTGPDLRVGQTERRNGSVTLQPVPPTPGEPAQRGRPSPSEVKKESAVTTPDARERAVRMTPPAKHALVEADRCHRQRPRLRRRRAKRENGRDERISGTSRRSGPTMPRTSEEELGQSFPLETTPPPEHNSHLHATHVEVRAAVTPSTQSRYVRTAPPARDASAEVPLRMGDNAVPNGRQPRLPCPRTQRKNGPDLRVGRTDKRDGSQTNQHVLLPPQGPLAVTVPSPQVNLDSHPRRDSDVRERAVRTTQAAAEASTESTGRTVEQAKSESPTQNICEGGHFHVGPLGVCGPEVSPKPGHCGRRQHQPPPNDAATRPCPGQRSSAAALPEGDRPATRPKPRQRRRRPHLKKLELAEEATAATS